MTDSLTCPRCGMTTHHPVDITEGYCGKCNDWTSEAGGSGRPIAATTPASKDRQERMGVSYMQELSRAERTGELVPLGMGPLAALNLLGLLEFGAKAPGPGQERHRKVVDDLEAQTGEFGITRELNAAGVEALTVTMRDLAAREAAGERHLVLLGPFTVMLMIGLLQMTTRHPEVQDAHKVLAGQFVQMFGQVFDGTYGAILVEQGNDPAYDHTY